MKHKIIYGFLALALLSMLVLSGCKAPINQAEKRACINSGGAYKSGFSETGGSYWYCDCPYGTYADGFTCKPVESEEIQLCNALTTSYATCNAESGNCICIRSDGVKISTIPLWQLVSEDCICRGCDESWCNCMC